MRKTTSNDILDDMWVDFDNRIWQFCKYLGVKKWELALQIGMPQQRLSRLKEGKHHAEAEMLLYTFPELNARWLLFGDGEMLNPQQTETMQAATLSDGSVWERLYREKDNENKLLIEEIGKLKRDIENLQPQQKNKKVI